jgi:hypothetical protein
VDLAIRAAGWKLGTAPVLGDQAYGDNTELRDRLHSEGLQYVLSVSHGDERVHQRGCQFFRVS